MESASQGVMRKLGISFVAMVAIAGMVFGCSVESKNHEGSSSLVAGPQPLTRPLVSEPVVRKSSKPAAIPQGSQPPMPLKPQEVLAQLRSGWDAALDAEKKFLLSPRLRGWIEDLETQSDPASPGSRAVLDEGRYAQLNPQERLAYRLFYPEGQLEDGEYEVSYAGQMMCISRWLPDDPQGRYLSARQMTDVLRDTSAIRPMILDCIATNGSVSIPMMQEIVRSKFKRSLPALIAVYERQAVKDDLLLTTLSEVMEKSNFWEWLKGNVCHQMVLDPNGTAPLSPENIAEIIAYARKFAGG